MPFKVKQDYEGLFEDSNPLMPLLMWELLQALLNKPDVKWDDNCQLEVKSPNGTVFNIFVDCGDFDYFEWAVLPDGTRLDYGNSALRELEYHWSSAFNKLFDDLIRGISDAAETT